jgi:hypothetical protein
MRQKVIESLVFFHDIFKYLINGRKRTTGYLALWIELLTLDQEDMSSYHLRDRTCALPESGKTLGFSSSTAVRNIDSKI